MALASMFAPDPGFDLDPEAARRRREATAAGRLAQTISNSTSTGSQTHPTVGTTTTGGWNPNPYAGQVPTQAGGVRPDAPSADDSRSRPAGQTPPWGYVPGQTGTAPAPSTGGWNPSAALGTLSRTAPAPAGQTPPWAGTVGAPVDPKPTADTSGRTGTPGQTPPIGYIPGTTPGMVPVEQEPAVPYADPGARGGATPTTSSFTDPGTATGDPRTAYSTANAGAVPRVPTVPTPPVSGTTTPPDDTSGARTRVPNPVPPGGRRTSPPDDPGTPVPPVTVPGTPPPTTPPTTTPPGPVDTNGYAVPGYTRPGAGSAPAGWDPAKWDDQNYQSPKYVVGRILSNYPATPAGLAAAMADIEKAYPGAKAVGIDKVDVPGVGVIDVLQGSQQGGVAWQWLDTTWEANNPTPAPTGTGDGDNTPAPAPTPNTPGGPDGPSVPKPNETPKPATPAYQTYQYNTPTPNAPAPPPLLAPSTIGQYQAGKAPTFDKADTSAQTDAAAAQAATANPFAAGASNPATQAAMQALMQAMGFAIPDAAGAKEAAKETMNSARTQELEALQRQAQAAGLGRSGALMGAQAEIGDGFSGGLTRAYREIDAATQQAGFANSLAASGALSGLGQVQGNEARADYQTGQAGQQQQFDQNMSLAQLLESINQNNYASTLAGSGQQAQMDQAAAASAQAAGRYGLDWDAARQGQAQTAFQNALASAGFNFQQQQAQAGENYQYAALGQQNTQFNKQLEAQAAQAAAQMGFNWAQLGQQDKQFFMDLQLKAALGSASQNQAYLDSWFQGLQ